MSYENHEYEESMSVPSVEKCERSPLQRGHARPNKRQRRSTRRRRSDATTLNSPIEAEYACRVRSSAQSVAGDPHVEIRETCLISEVRTHTTQFAEQPSGSYTIRCRQHKRVGAVMLDAPARVGDQNADRAPGLQA